nr:hypothetical protein [Tanacetum cinerariifolium]
MEVAGKDGKNKKEKKNKGLLRASKINDIEVKAMGKDGNPLRRVVCGVHGVNDNDKGYSNEKMNIGTGSHKNNESVNDTSVSNSVTLTSTNDAPTNTSHAHDLIRPKMRVGRRFVVTFMREHVNMENGWAALVNEVTDIKETDKIEAKTVKTEHKMERA